MIWALSISSRRCSISFFIFLMYSLTLINLFQAWNVRFSNRDSESLKFSILFTYQNLLLFLTTMSSWDFWCWLKRESFVIWLRRMTWKIEWIFMNTERFNLMIRELFLKTRLILKKSTLWLFNLTARWAMLRLQVFSQTSSSTKYLKQERRERLTLNS